jgi:hypothetical protein
MVKFVLKTDGGCEINLCKIVSKNNVVFVKALKK